MPKQMRRRQRRGSTLRNFESVITSQSFGEQQIAKLFDIYCCIFREPARHIKLTELSLLIRIIRINVKSLNIWMYTQVYDVWSESKNGVTFGMIKFGPIYFIPQFAPDFYGRSKKISMKLLCKQGHNLSPNWLKQGQLIYQNLKRSTSPPSLPPGCFAIPVFHIVLVHSYLKMKH